jgi:hypothetical protein
MFPKTASFTNQAIRRSAVIAFRLLLDEMTDEIVSFVSKPVSFGTLKGANRISSLRIL